MGAGIAGTIGIAMGLNVRVGMQDNVLYRRGEPVVTNAQLALRGRVAGATPAT